MTQLIDLGKLRFHFAGDWLQSTVYESNDIVKYGGNVYVYTYALKSAGTLPIWTSHWALMIEGFNFQGEFDASTPYKVGDGIAHGGVVYISIKDATNITPPNNTYWSRFLDGIQYEGEYSDSANYQKNDVVRYGGSIYISKQDTINHLPTNATFWDKFVEGVSPSGVYNDATAYKPNDLVAYGANIYRAKVETTSHTPSDATYWELYVGGIKFTGAYSSATEYYVNDIVVYGNNVYRSRQTQSNTLPTVDAKWELLVSGSAYQGQYNNSTNYHQGDIVNYGGNVYIALNVTAGHLPTDVVHWSVYTSGFDYQGVWSSVLIYHIGQVVSYGGSLYQAKSDNDGINPTTAETWVKIVAGIKTRGNWATASEYATEEVVTYGGNTFISLLPHASANFNTDLDEGKWQKFNSGISWRGIWSSLTQYYKDDVVKAGSSSFIADVDIIGGNNPASGVIAGWSNFATGAEGFLSKDGDAMLGMLTMFADPTDPLHAATKHYVDQFINAADGGTVTGPLVADGVAASLTMINGAQITIDGGAVNLINGATLLIDGTSSLGAVTIDGDTTIQNGDIKTTQTTINVLNDTVTTVNAFGSATNINVGNDAGNATIKGDVTLTSGDIKTTQTTISVLNNTATTVNAFGSATNINIGNDAGNAAIKGDVTLTSGDIKTTQTTIGLLDETVTTVNAFGSATTVDIGATTGTTTIKNNVVVDGVLDVIPGSTVTNTTMDPTGFDNNHTNTRGIIEFSDDGTKIYQIDQNSVVTVRADSKFATGTNYEVSSTAKTLVIYPVAGQSSFVYWLHGTRYTVNTLKSITLSSIHNKHYVYFNDGNLESAAIRTDSILVSYANVASLYGSTVNNKITSLTDERHGISIDGASLVYADRVDGIKYINGLGLNAIANEDTYTSTKSGELRDGDLLVNVPTKSNNKFATRLGDAWKISDYNDNFYSYKLGVLSTASVTNPGAGYRSSTTSITVGGDGEGAVIEPVYSGAPIQEVLLTNGGYGYSADTTTTLTGDGTGAAVSITIPAGHNVSSVAIGNAGSGYTNLTAAVSGSGTAATVAVVLDYGTPIAAVHMTALGSGYTAATATITGDGTGATASLTIVAGAITDIDITNVGSGYTTATVTINGSGGTGAAATVHTRKSFISNYEITNVGSGYTTAVVTISGDGHGATATAQVTAGGVTDIVITDGGHGYTTASMSITGNGVGALAVPVLSGYPIKTLTLTNRGKNYLTTPSIVFSQSGLGKGTNATATATLSSGNSISSATLTTPGINYTGATLTLNNVGSGTGAEFNFVTSPSGIVGITVVDGGRHYSYANVIVNSPTGAGAVFTLGLTPVPQYNNYVDVSTGYDLNNIPVGKYTNTYFVATNSVDRVLKIPSSYIFDYEYEAFQYINKEIRELKDAGLPFEKYEFVGASILNSGGQVQTISNTNQGDIQYYDLTSDNYNDTPIANIDDIGKSLTVGQDGLLDWIGATSSENVIYVAPHGVDDPYSGKTIANPYASIKYACQRAVIGATIFVKTGTYTEQLPIVVPANVAIVGDNQRTVVIQPKTGNSDDGVTLNTQSTMFKLSNGSILNKMTFKGMTGWVPGTTAGDVTTSTVKGVVVGFNPDSPVTTKPPYVLECAFIGSGAIGALIDGSAHSSGTKTMIFNGYTVTSDNGVGYWASNDGKAEIVSCFTYYAHFGYTSSNGGEIRALNGNNSYGTWGATSRGYSASETPSAGTIYGEELNFTYIGGAIDVGGTVTGPTGSATVSHVQYTANKVYIHSRTGTFAVGNALTFTGGGTGTVSTGGVGNQKGVILILTGLSALPIAGGSIKPAGDTVTYVIQSVSGTYVNSSSKIVVVLSKEKTTGSAHATAIAIRYKYSQVRLTGHDFVSIGTGGVTTTNYPGAPTQPINQGNETDEVYPGRVYYVSTDQEGNFRVGEHFRIDQATGKATLNTTAFNLDGLTSLRFGSIDAQLGEAINEFSSDVTMSGNSNIAVPTEKAVKTFVDAKISSEFSSATVVKNAAGMITAYTQGQGYSVSAVTFDSKNRTQTYIETSYGVTKVVSITYDTTSGAITSILKV